MRRSSTKTGHSTPVRTELRERNSGLPAPSTLDFSNMTRSELRNTVNALIKSGKLSLNDTLGVTLMMGPPLKMGPGGTVSIGPDSDSKMDVLLSLQARIDGAKSRDDDKAASMFSQTLTALERLQGTVVGLDLQV